MKSSRLAMLALAATLTLAGCSGGDDGGDDRAGESSASGDASPSADAQSAAEGIVSPADLPEEPSFTNEGEGIIKDVDVEECQTGPGDVTARGTATNTGRFARDVVVTINWAVTETSDVVARGIATVEDLEPGESGDWEVEASYDVDEPVGCVTTARAGQLAE